jgi:NCS2 family nucleobase:cation symporter-2
LSFPAQRPSEQEILEASDGMSRLAGYLLRHNADRIRAETRGDQAHIWFHFDH